MPADNFVIVTGADRNFYGPLTDLLDSIRDTVRPVPPIANAGVFALKADAPHWGLRQRAMEGRPTQMWDQTALNYVIHHDGAPTGLLPDLCNWICIDAPPEVDEASGLFVEPEPPYRPISILHLVGQAKTLKFKIESLRGGHVEGTLRYSAWRPRRLATG